jgi:excisionase family DNA binding protein
MAGKVTILREYLSIKELSQYCGICERTLRDLINDSTNPIPSYRFGRGAIRVKKEEFDCWAKTCRNDNNRLNQIVNEVLADLGIKSKSSTRRSEAAHSKRSSKKESKHRTRSTAPVH